MPHVNHEPWFSRKGWFTVVSTPSGLECIELPAKDTKLIRALGGILFDREGFGPEVLKYLAKNGKTMQYKKYRLYIPPRLCECQYTGWKPYE